MPGLAVPLVLLLAVCSLGPGFFFVRRLRWSPPEKLSAAVGLSLFLVYLASFAIYALGLPATLHFAVTGISGLLLFLARRDLARLFSCAAVRRQLGAFAFLLAWALALLALVRHYSGGQWAGDWLEHYERALFFLDRLPADTVFIDLYPLPARPPLWNVLAAHSMAQVGRGYDVFQVAFLFLNLLSVLPLLLLATALVRRAGRRTALIAGALAASPMLLQNVTWPWTKLGAGFYVCLALWLYLRGWKKRDSLRTVLAFGALAVGVLVHYSAGPYAVLLGLHYLVVVLPARRRWRELAVASLVGAAALLPWFGWSLAVYGGRTTFASNTTVAGAAGLSASETLERVGTNLVSTLVPHPLRPAASAEMRAVFEQASRLGYLRDYTFLLYQVNAVAAMGSLGGLFVLVLLWRRLAATGRSERRFWALLLLGMLVLGVAVVSQGDTFGLAHVCLQPVLLLGVVFLAASLPDLPRWVRGLALAGWLVDFALGVLLHFGMENRVATLVQSATGEPLVRNTAGLSESAALNWGYKAVKELVFFGDRFAPLAGSIEIALALAYAVLLGLTCRRLLLAPRARPAVAAASVTARS